LLDSCIVLSPDILLIFLSVYLLVDMEESAILLITKKWILPGFPEGAYVYSCRPKKNPFKINNPKRLNIKLLHTGFTLKCKARLF